MLDKHIKVYNFSIGVIWNLYVNKSLSKLKKIYIADIHLLIIQIPLISTTDYALFQTLHSFKLLNTNGKTKPQPKPELGKRLSPEIIQQLLRNTTPNSIPNSQQSNVSSHSINLNPLPQSYVKNLLISKLINLPVYS